MLRRTRTCLAILTALFMTVAPSAEGLSAESKSATLLLPVIASAERPIAVPESEDCLACMTVYQSGTFIGGSCEPPAPGIQGFTNCEDYDFEGQPNCVDGYITCNGDETPELNLLADNTVFDGGAPVVVMAPCEMTGRQIFNQQALSHRSEIIGVGIM